MFLSKQRRRLSAAKEEVTQGQKLAAKFVARASPADLAALRDASSLVDTILLHRVEALSDCSALQSWPAGSPLKHLEIQVDNEQCDHLHYIGSLTSLESLRVRSRPANGGQQGLVRAPDVLAAPPQTPAMGANGSNHNPARVLSPLIRQGRLGPPAPFPLGPPDVLSFC